MKRLERIYVPPEFKRMIKRKSAEEDRSMIDILDDFTKTDEEMFEFKLNNKKRGNFFGKI